MTDEALFDLAMKTPPAERAALLDRACGVDRDLRARVEFLLLAAPEEPVTSQRNDLAAPHSHPEGVGRASETIGPYRLVQKLGEGGMGAVWAAEQTIPVRRKVALKLIKPGMDSSRIVARFEAERQALAMMDHASIARMYDAGRTPDGRPYFVMELVKGVPITKYCDEVHASVEDRLRLFAEVCAAVQHAHTKGVVHRDLKPTNVLVAIHDGRPVPKVIDFGVAKALHQPLTERTLETELGQVIGTLEYMAPEQAELSALDVDTRADVYALGVLLYELLVGSTPIGRERMRKAAFVEVLRLIKDEEPQKPSTRLSHSKESLASVAAVRRTDPRRLQALLVGELDWVVLKALEKDRTRRYETAAAFRQDVERYLADEPIDARPPSVVYRVGKFMRRHRGLAAAIGAVAAALVVGVVGLALGLAEANRARLAESKRAEGERLAKDEAVRRLGQLEKGNELLGSIFTDLDLREVKRGGEPLEAVLAGRLVKAAAQLEGEAIGDPLAVATLQRRLGWSLVSLGHPRAAHALFAKALEIRRPLLGADHPDVLDSVNDVASALKADGQLQQALRLFEDVLERRQAGLGADHPDTLTGMNNVALCYREAGEPARALPLFEECLERRRAALGADHRDTLASINNLAASYKAAGKLDRAIPLFEEALSLSTAALGPDHPTTLNATSNLALTLEAAGQRGRALPLMEDAVRLMKGKMGADHPSTLTAMNNLAMGQFRAGRRDVARSIFEEVLKVRKAKMGVDHPDTLASANNLATVYLSDGRTAEAAAVHDEAAAGVERLGFRHEYAAIVPDAATTLEAAKRFDRAEHWRRKWLAVVKSRSKPESPEYANALHALGANLLRQRKWGEAEAPLREFLTIAERVRPDVWSTFNAASLLGAALLGQKRHAEAEPFLLRGFEGLRARAGAIPPPAGVRLREAADRLVELYESVGKAEAAARWKGERAKLPAAPPQGPVEARPPERKQ